MLVKCPQCKTTYKVSDEALKGIAPAFRCSRCKHTFDLEAQEPAEEPTEEASSPEHAAPGPAEDRELSFAFAHKAKEDAESFTDTAAQGETRSAKGKEHLDQWSMSDSESKKEQRFTFSDVHASENTEKIIGAPENTRPQAPQFRSTSSQHETGDNIFVSCPVQRSASFHHALLDPLRTAGPLLLVCGSLQLRPSDGHRKCRTKNSASRILGAQKQSFEKRSSSSIHSRGLSQHPREPRGVRNHRGRVEPESG